MKSIAAAGLTLLAAATLAPAQTDNAVIDRILVRAPSLTTYDPQPDHYAPLTADALTAQYVELVAPAMIPAAAHIAATTIDPDARASAHVRGATTPAGITRTASARTPIAPAITRHAVAPSSRALTARVSDQPLALSPAQRALIYRAAMQHLPHPLVASVGPATESNYPLHTIYPADDSYGSRSTGSYAIGSYAATAYVDRAVGEPALGYQDNALDPYHTAYRWNGIPLVVGARIPASVLIAALPEPVVARIPAARPYGYAVLDRHVLLVDPATRIIVATIAP